MKKAVVALTLFTFLLLPIQAPAVSLLAVGRALLTGYELIGTTISIYQLVRGDPSQEQNDRLSKDLRDLQIAAAEIPSLRRQISELRADLSERPTRDEVLRRLRELRADLETEIRKIEKRVGKLERRADETDKRLDNQGLRLTELEMRPRPLTAHILFTTGGELRDVILGGPPDRAGVKILLSSGASRTYRASDVRIVSVAAGSYQYNRTTGEFAFHPIRAGDSPPFRDPAKTGRPLARITGDSVLRQDEEALAILRSLTRAQLYDLTIFATRRGRTWNEMSLVTQLDMLKQKILQDERDRIRRLCAETGLTELQVLRTIIHQKAQALSKR